MCRPTGFSALFIYTRLSQATWSATQRTQILHWFYRRRKYSKCWHLVISKQNMLVIITSNSVSLGICAYAMFDSTSKHNRINGIYVESFEKMGAKQMNMRKSKWSRLPRIHAVEKYQTIAFIWQLKVQRNENSTSRSVFRKRRKQESLAIHTKKNYEIVFFSFPFIVESSWF